MSALHAAHEIEPLQTTLLAAHALDLKELFSMKFSINYNSVKRGIWDPVEFDSLSLGRIRFTKLRHRNSKAPFK